MSFRVITPLDITDAMLTSSTIAEPDTGENAWSNATTYALKNVVYLASTHTLYESLQDSNTNHDPAADVQGDPDNPPVWWLEIGKTNRWNMFNLLRNQKSVGAAPMTIVLTQGTRIDSIGLFGMEAESVTISMVNYGTEVYSHTENLNRREVLDWYDYVFLPFETNPSMARFDLPPYTDAVITVTLDSTQPTVKLGSLVIGTNANIGDVQYGAESDVLNFSRIERAFDGTALLKKRRSIPKTIQNIFADKSKANKIRALRTALNATPAVYAGLDQTDHPYFEALLILGIYKRFSIRLDHPTSIIIDLEIEEI